MARTSHQDTGRAIVMLSLLLLAVGVAVGWLVWPAPASPPAQQPTEEARRPDSPGSPAPLGPRDDPADETPDQPVPPPEIDREPVELPFLTRFRSLVLEADSALAVRDDPGAPAEQLWKHASTLEKLESRFAPFALAAAHGKDGPEDRRHFVRDATRSFERPDVGSAAWTVQAGPRVAMWSRPGVAFPPAETEPPPGVRVPFERRLHETVSVESASRWLAAIEGEYGEGTFGRLGLPLDVLVFPDLSRYLAFSKQRLALDVPRWSAGYYSSRWEIISLPVTDGTSAAEVIRHEMFHALQAQLAPASLTVPWFAEGSAEWLDKAPPRDGLRTDTEFAAAAYGYLRQLVANGYAVRLKEFLALEMEEFYASPELNYLLAYCFVDFCRAEEDLKAVYFDFWRLMCEGVPPDNAFARSFGGLDFDDLQRRFIERINAFPRVTEPPRFSHDAPAEHFDKAPREWPGRVAPPGVEGEVSEGWYPVLGALQRRGFDTSRAGFLGEDFDRLVVAVDSSESMGRRITTDGFDFEALSVWLFSLRYAGTLAFSRKSVTGDSSEEIPPLITMVLVDAVVTGRLEVFNEAAGIRVPDDIQEEIRKSYRDFDLAPDALKEMSRREIALHTAESIAWYWNTRQDESDVTVVDFSLDVQIESEKARGRFGATDSPLRRLFKKTEPNAAPPGSDRADTDWWAGLQGVVNEARGGDRVACLFFTDGPNSLGTYGHFEDGRDDYNYMNDQSKLAESLKLEWEGAGLDDAERGLLQLIALPGAEGQGLDYIPQQLPAARLDEWTAHFVK